MGFLDIFSWTQRITHAVVLVRQEKWGIVNWGIIKWSYLTKITVKNTELVIFVKNIPIKHAKLYMYLCIIFLLIFTIQNKYATKHPIWSRIRRRTPTIARYKLIFDPGYCFEDWRKILMLRDWRHLRYLWLGKFWIMELGVKLMTLVPRY